MDKDTENWKLCHDGTLYRMYRWDKNDNIKARFNITDDGINIGVWYDNIPIDFTSYVSDPLDVVVERSLPMLDGELNWFVGNFTKLLGELAKRIDNGFEEVNAGEQS